MEGDGEKGAKSEGWRKGGREPVRDARKGELRVRRIRRGRTHKEQDLRPGLGCTKIERRDVVEFGFVQYMLTSFSAAVAISIMVVIGVSNYDCNYCDLGNTRWQILSRCATRYVLVFMRFRFNIVGHHQ